jgi:hypothetical protein
MCTVCGAKLAGLEIFQWKIRKAVLTFGHRLKQIGFQQQM